MVVPDTRQLLSNDRFDKYTPQWERFAIQSISPDGRTVTLASPLSFDHEGARDGDGLLEFLPHVGNLSRNVVIRSENANGVRGHTLFTERADIDIRYVGFAGLGRTTNQQLDSTTFDGAGNVTHVGTNQIGRYPVHFHHLLGPQATPANGYQFTFVGNSVFCPMSNHDFKWGIAVHASHYGLIKDNVLYNWAGAGIVTEDGTESFNVFEHNFITAIRGSTNPRDNDGREAAGFWMAGFNNYVRDNVVANATNSFVQIVSGVGYKYFVQAALGQPVRIPLFAGADVNIEGQYQLQYLQRTPILEFARNEAYGAMASGMTIWHLGSSGYNAEPIPESTVRDFLGWHLWEEAFFGYPIQNVTFDGFVVRGSSRAFHPFDAGGAWTSGDYWAGDVTIRRADIQGMYVGISGSTNTPGQFLIEDSYFRNYLVNIAIPTLATPGSGAFKPPRQTQIINTRFEAWPAHPSSRPLRWATIQVRQIQTWSKGMRCLSTTSMAYQVTISKSTTTNNSLTLSCLNPSQASSPGLLWLA